MKNITSFLKTILICSGIFLTLTANIFASGVYSVSEVAKHNTENDCWMIISKNVYNLTNYLSEHDKQMDIRSWCGKEASKEFATKAGRGLDHSERAKNILETFLVGSVQAESNAVLPAQKDARRPNGYNVIFPVVGTIIVYLLSLRFLERQRHNLIWNSIMLLGLIPSLGFGIIMALGGKAFFGGRILYNHIELSLIFGTACVMHFLLRLKIYLAQMKKL